MNDSLAEHPLGQVLHSELRIPLTTTSDSRLIEDLGLDSMAMLELAAILDEAGVDMPDALFENLETIGDVLHYFDVIRSRA